MYLNFLAAGAIPDEKLQVLSSELKCLDGAWGLSQDLQEKLLEELEINGSGRLRIRWKLVPLIAITNDTLDSLKPQMLLPVVQVKTKDGFKELLRVIFSYR